MLKADCITNRHSEGGRKRRRRSVDKKKGEVATNLLEEIMNMRNNRTE